MLTHLPVILSPVPRLLRLESICPAPSLPCPLSTLAGATPGVTTLGGLVRDDTLGREDIHHVRKTSSLVKVNSTDFLPDFFKNASLRKTCASPKKSKRTTE
jgi:hypothetical protein